MCRLSVLDVPQTRDTPHDVLTALQEIDPSMTLVHLSADRWLFAYMAGDSVQVEAGRRMLENTKRVLASLARTHPNPSPVAAQKRRDRLTVATVKAMGGIGTRIYQSRSPDGALVEQIRQDDFYQRHTSEQEFWRQYDAIEEKAEAERLADLTDHARANDVWRHSNTLSHTPGISTYGTAPVHRSSVRTLHRTI